MSNLSKRIGGTKVSLVLGLTGSIASGKSTVSKMIADYKIPIIDADLISRQIVSPGKDAYQRIVESFGDCILQKDKTINRKKLGSLIFSNENKRQILNEIMHPAIREEMLKERNHYIEKGEKCVVLDIPLLFESNLTHFVDKIIVVCVDEKTQLNRLMKRDNSTMEEAKQRIKSQLPMIEKVQLADVVINNNGSTMETHDQLDGIFKKWNII